MKFDGFELSFESLLRRVAQLARLLILTGTRIGAVTVPGAVGGEPIVAG